MSQSGHHPILTQLRHISIIGLNRDESESEWYIVIWDIHELTRPMLTPTQSHSWKIRHIPHHIEHHQQCSQSQTPKPHSDMATLVHTTLFLLHPSCFPRDFTCFELCFQNHLHPNNSDFKESSSDFL